jgi:hypothetical protein
MTGRFTLALAGTALALCAADSWLSKDYTAWTSEETKRVLTNSPWARETTTSIADYGPGMLPPGGSAESGGRNGGGGMGAGGMGGGGMGSQGAGAGGMGNGGLGSAEGMGGGGNRGGRGGMGQGGMMMEAQKVTIRWESALPVREALLKAKFGEKLPAPGDPALALDQPEKEYIIAVAGLQMPMMTGGGHRPEDLAGAGPGTDPSTGARRDRLLHAAQLVRKGKDPITPTDVVMDNAVNALVVRFKFPRTDAISADDKEVKFICQMGPMRVERKFALKEMIFNGKLEL